MAEPAQIVGFIIGIPIATRLLARDAGLVLRFLAAVTVVVAVAWVAFALAPDLPIAIGTNIIISGVLGLLVPGIYSVLSLALPPKVRAFGFAVAAVWIIPGLHPAADRGRARRHLRHPPGLLIAAPVFVVGGRDPRLGADHR